MRYVTLSLVIAALLTSTACAGKSSSNSSDQSSTSSDQSNAMATATAAATDAATEAPSTAPGDVPAYPGAVTEASGSGSNMSASGSGTVMSTDDSFDKVYAWYQQHLPAGAEKTHTTSPPAAVFTIGDPSSGLKSVSLTTSDGKTRITIGTVKTQ
ncbi:MAG TPA: hypothetical protein VFE16_10175 [Candidatus Cybelea sp.]|jgi:hypothetical protein|nr:hypothetical protein [Candidatus Cybelea sp.]